MTMVCAVCLSISVLYLYKISFTLAIVSSLLGVRFSGVLSGRFLLCFVMNVEIGSNKPV